MMRSIWLVALLIPFAGCAGTSAPTYEAESAPSCGNLTKYASPDGDYAFCIPQDWRIETDDGETYGLEWVLFSPSLDDTPEFQENVNLGRVSNRGGPPLSELAVAMRKELEGVFEEYHHLGTATSSVGSHEAVTLHYRGSTGGTEVEGWQTLAYGTGQLYVLTYTTQPGPNTYGDDVDGAYDSFRFLVKG